VGVVHTQKMTLADQVVARGDFFDFLARAVPSRGVSPVLVAIDGVDGSGKSMFAKNLAEAIERNGRPTVVVHVDDFHNLSEVRHRRGRESPEGFWLDSYD